MVTFNYLEKSEFNNLSIDIFSILATNMIKIAPTGNTYEDDYQSWFCAVKDGLVKEQRKIILIYFENKIIGFLQYYIDNIKLIMEEIQIHSDWQGKKYSGTYTVFYLQI